MGRHSKDSCECKRKKSKFIPYLKSKLIKTHRLKADCISAGRVVADEIILRNPSQSGDRGELVQNDDYIPSIIQPDVETPGQFQASYILPAVIRPIPRIPACGSGISQAFTNINLVNDLNQLEELELFTYLA